jgi:hypothetical protein
MPKLWRTIFIEEKYMSVLWPLDGGAGDFILSILGRVVAYRRRAYGEHCLYRLHDAEQNALKPGDLAGNLFHRDLFTMLDFRQDNSQAVVFQNETILQIIMGMSKFQTLNERFEIDTINKKSPEFSPRAFVSNES